MSGAAVCVSLRGLTRRFGESTAVDALRFDVREGELFGIVGPDGAGKTTTLRMLAGVLPPSEGDAVIRGVSVAGDPEGVKPHIAYMAQRFGLYEDLTVRENIEFYADLYRVPKAERAARLERLYRFSKLGDFEDRLAGALSGGMKQKLSLSCALIHEPAVLLLDEPTFGVDPISRRDLWLILHERVARGATVITTTSYLDEAERCDRVALLDHGRVLALGAPAELQARLRGRLFAVRIEGDAAARHGDAAARHGGAGARPSAAPAGKGQPPGIRAARDALRAAPAVERATLFGGTLHVVAAPEAPAGGRVRGGEGGSGRGGALGAARPSSWADRSGGARARGEDGPNAADAIRGALDAAGFGAATIEPIEPSLEDVFIGMVEAGAGRTSAPEDFAHAAASGPGPATRPSRSRSRPPGGGAAGG